MPLKTYESQVSDGVRTVESRVSRYPFTLKPSDAVRILGVSREAVDEARRWRDTVLDDSLLLTLAEQVTNGPLYGWREPGRRSLTVDNRTGQTRFIFRAADGAYRTMVLSAIVNNPPRV